MTNRTRVKTLEDQVTEICDEIFKSGEIPNYENVHPKVFGYYAKKSVEGAISRWRVKNDMRVHALPGEGKRTKLTAINPRLEALEIQVKDLKSLVDTLIEATEKNTETLNVLCGDIQELVQIWTEK